MARIGVARADGVLEDEERLIVHPAPLPVWADPPWSPGIGYLVAVFAVGAVVSHGATGSMAGMAGTAMVVLALYVSAVQGRKRRIIVLDRAQGWLIDRGQRICRLRDIGRLDVLGGSRRRTRRIAFVSRADAGGRTLVLHAFACGAEAASGLCVRVAGFLGLDGLLAAAATGPGGPPPLFVDIASGTPVGGAGGTVVVLIRALLEGDRDAGVVARQALSTVGDARSLARRAIGSPELTARERLEAIGRLTESDEYEYRGEMRALVGDIRAFCTVLLSESEAEAVRIGARELLEELSGRTLLRPASGPPQAPQEQLLRPRPEAGEQ